MLWFTLPEDTNHDARELPAQPQPPGTQHASGTSDEPERDPVLGAPWNHRGTVEVAVVSPPCALPTVPMTGHLAPTSSRPWPIMPPAKDSPLRE